MKKLLLGVLVLSLAAGSAEAALFAGPSSFTVLPNSQLGPIVNNTLVLTDTANGFFVSGFVDIQLTAPASGILVAWEIDRPLDFPHTQNGLFSTTVLDGFSLPPVGNFGNTSGVVSSYITDPTYTGVSTSNLFPSLPSGAATWTNLTSSSTNFNYTATGTGFSLRQDFFLDGVFINGPPGLWRVDVPAGTFVGFVPEPASALLAAIAGLVALTCSRRN